MDTVTHLPALLSEQQRAMLARVRRELVQEKNDDRDHATPNRSRGNGGPLASEEEDKV